MAKTKWVRTDLALELRSEHLREFAKENDEFLCGVEYTEEECGGFFTNTIKITNDDGSRIIGKEKGTYITVQSGAVWKMDSARFYSCAEVVAQKIRHLCDEVGYDGGTVLVCGLGNRDITPDSIGPCAAQRVIVTSHLKRMDPKLYEKMELGDVSAIVPGVLGQTGMESATLVRAAANAVRPSLIIAIDALAAREINNLATTVQLCDTGVSPGSGVGNRREGISKDSLGVPVICIGVPTVVDTATLVYDALSEAGLDSQKEELSSVLDSLGQDRYFVSPKDMDKISDELSNLVACAVNKAFHEKLSFEDMERL